MIELVIVTPQGEAFRGQVESVVLPGSEGDFGVLEGHERFLCPLRAGAVEIKTDGTSQFASIAGGFADISGSEAAVLAESCELSDAIDVARAEAARDRAQRGLEATDDEEDAAAHADHAAALVRAEIRLEIAKKG